MASNGLAPLIRYRDVAAAVEWLSSTFGFEVQSVVRDEDGTIVYAEMRFGGDVVMIGPVGDSSLDALLRQPDEVGGLGTQACYVAVSDVAAHYAHAKASGAEIVLAFGSEEAGDRAYAARDLEGHVWNFGGYSPWRRPVASAAPARPRSAPVLHSALAVGVVALAAATSAAVWIIEPDPIKRTEIALRGSQPAQFAPTLEDTAALEDVPDRGSAPPEAAALESALERAEHVKREFARTAAELRAGLDRERTLRQAAETEARTAKSELVRTRQDVLALQKLLADPTARPSAQTASPQTGVPLPQPKEPPRETATLPDPSPTKTLETAPVTAPEPQEAIGAEKTGVETSAQKSDGAAGQPGAAPAALPEQPAPQPKRTVRKRLPKKAPSSPSISRNIDPFFTYDP